MFVFLRGQLFTCLVFHTIHTIRKVKFLSKNSILTKPQHFHEFFTQNFFLTIFLVKSKLSTVKKSKTTTFSQVFHPEKSTIFSGNQSRIFGQKIKISNSVKFYSLFSSIRSINVDQISTRIETHGRRSEHWLTIGH